MAFVNVAHHARLAPCTSAFGSTSPKCARAQRRRSRVRSTPRCSDMGLSFPTRKYDEQLRIGIVSTRWNEQYVQAMVSQAVATLSEQGISGADIVQMQVAGAFEIPMAARFMAASQKVDAVICLGVLIKGETDHYSYIARAVSGGLMDLQLTLQIPMVFGVLCCTTEQQVKDRTVGDKAHAADYAKTAIEMAQLRKSQMGGVSAGKKSVGFF